MSLSRVSTFQPPQKVDVPQQEPSYDLLVFNLSFPSSLIEKVDEINSYLSELPEPTHVEFIYDADTEDDDKSGLFSKSDDLTIANKVLKYTNGSVITFCKTNDALVFSIDEVSRYLELIDEYSDISRQPNVEYKIIPQDNILLIICSYNL